MTNVMHKFFSMYLFLFITLYMFLFPSCTHLGHQHRTTVTRGCIDTICASRWSFTKNTITIVCKTFQIFLSATYIWSRIVKYFVHVPKQHFVIAYHLVNQLKSIHWLYEAKHSCGSIFLDVFTPYMGIVRWFVTTWEGVEVKLGSDLCYYNFGTHAGGPVWRRQRLTLFLSRGLIAVEADTQFSVCIFI